jgi:hypothetical protein
MKVDIRTPIKRRMYSKAVGFLFHQASEDPGTTLQLNIAREQGKNEARKGIDYFI